MTKPFDMDLFFAGVLTGAKTTRERHIRKPRLFKQPFPIAGTETVHGHGKKSIFCGY